MEAARSPWPALGVLLVRDGLVSAEDLETVLTSQEADTVRPSSRRLGELLVERGLVTGSQVARLVAEQHELPFVDLDDPDAKVPLAARIPEELARRYAALPIRIFPDGSLLVVVADPTEAGIFDEIRRSVGVPVRFAVGAPDAIETAIDAAASTHSFREPDAEPMASLLLATDATEPPIMALDWSPASTDPDGKAGSVRSWPVLGSLLLRDGLVTEHELETALAQQRLSNTRRLGEILVQRGTLTERQVAQALAEQHELPFVDLDEQGVDGDAASELPVLLARGYGALPVSYLPDGSLLVAVADPTSVIQSEELRAALGRPFEIAVASPDEIAAAIARLDGVVEPNAAAPEPEPEPEPEAEPEPDVERELEPETTLEVESTSEAVIEWEPDPEPEQELVVTRPELTVLEGGPPVHVLTEEIEAALALGATAVHVVSRGDGIVVRARIGDSLQEIATVASSEPESPMAGLSELAGLGRATFSVDGRTVELRPAVLPTVLGERVTFRVVDDELPPSSLTALLDDPNVSEALLESLAARRGLVLLCSPLPDDRSALLHAVLHEVAGPGRTIIAIEDPVEHLLAGVEQVEVDPRAGVTFATGLHAILRSDADLAAVGELLDPETVRLATRGADARCIVVATLAAGTAAAGAQRLVQLGAEPETLAAALGCVVALRRVRQVCLECRSSSYASAEELSLLGRPPEEDGRRLLATARGCDACGGTGLGSSTRIAEALRPTEDVRRLVARGATPREIEEAGVEAGMQTLAGRAAGLCLEGAITASEVAQLVTPTG